MKMTHRYTIHTHENKNTLNNAYQVKYRSSFPSNSWAKIFFVDFFWSFSLFNHSQTHSISMSLSLKKKYNRIHNTVSDSVIYFGITTFDEHRFSSKQRIFGEKNFECVFTDWLFADNWIPCMHWDSISAMCMPFHSFPRTHKCRLIIITGTRIQSIHIFCIYIYVYIYIYICVSARLNV